MAGPGDTGMPSIITVKMDASGSSGHVSIFHVRLRGHC